MSLKLTIGENLICFIIFAFNFHLHLVFCTAVPSNIAHFLPCCSTNCIGDGIQLQRGKVTIVLFKKIRFINLVFAYYFFLLKCTWINWWHFADKQNAFAPVFAVDGSGKCAYHTMISIKNQIILFSFPVSCVIRSETDSLCTFIRVWMYSRGFIAPFSEHA
jgi:hypothetical protein